MSALVATAFLIGLATGWLLCRRSRATELRARVEQERGYWENLTDILHAENVALRRVALEPEPDAVVASHLRARGDVSR